MKSLDILDCKYNKISTFGNLGSTTSVKVKLLVIVMEPSRIDGNGARHKFEMCFGRL